MIDFKNCIAPQLFTRYVEAVPHRYEEVGHQFWVRPLNGLVTTLIIALAIIEAVGRPLAGVIASPAALWAYCANNQQFLADYQQICFIEALEAGKNLFEGIFVVFRDAICGIYD